mmetsp:Transcript_28122/g.48143  ORF Transcript_28122/g.48143 Transcript_28122/m.48143 type:complete len:203 (-) Transcript_28122:3712-4320(-)
MGGTAFAVPKRYPYGTSSVRYFRRIVFRFSTVRLFEDHRGRLGDGSVHHLPPGCVLSTTRCYVVGVRPRSRIFAPVHDFLVFPRGRKLRLFRRGRVNNGVYHDISVHFHRRRAQECHHEGCSGRREPCAIQQRGFVRVGHVPIQLLGHRQSERYQRAHVSAAHRRLPRKRAEKDSLSVRVVCFHRTARAGHLSVPHCGQQQF